MAALTKKAPPHEVTKSNNFCGTMLVWNNKDMSLAEMRGFFVGANMDFYGGKIWEHKRQVILRRDGYLDQIEARYGRRVEANTVHHIFPVEYFPEWRLENWNLISVSPKTHNSLHDRTSDRLSEQGLELARRTARKRGLTVDWGRMA